MTTKIQKRTVKLNATTTIVENSKNHGNQAFIGFTGENGKTINMHISLLGSNPSITIWNEYESKSIDISVVAHKKTTINKFGHVRFECAGDSKSPDSSDSDGVI